MNQCSSPGRSPNATSFGSVSSERRTKRSPPATSPAACAKASNAGPMLCRNSAGIRFMTEATAVRWHPITWSAKARPFPLSAIPLSAIPLSARSRHRRSVGGLRRGGLHKFRCGRRVFVLHDADRARLG